MYQDPTTMTVALSEPITAFHGHGLLSSGPMIEVALAIKNVSEAGTTYPILAFRDATGRVVDFDLRGAKADIIARLAATPPFAATSKAEPTAPTAPLRGASDKLSGKPRARGRPKLGVVSREVTLLPRHWEWLAAQPGGASVTLRKLVDQARKTGDTGHQTRAAKEAAYHFMAAMAGDLPGFEEAARALFADDQTGFAEQMTNWPVDIRDYAMRLALSAPETGGVLANEDPHPTDKSATARKLSLTGT